MSTMLPEPRTERFQPLRSGLINLYKYEDQEFWFEHGRLLLRGNNGTGKSRVLALQLPFLFDGEISASRVEPDGDPAKALSWNLLMNEYDDRLGYTWIEFGRQPISGPPIFVTLGCGMRAIKGVEGLPNRWYFVTEKRVGLDFRLLTENRQPLSRDQLSATIGEAALYRTAQDYRKQVDSRLFGLKTRYGALIELLIKLRQPQLARKLDEDRVSGALSEALPPLSDALMDDLADSFRSLDSLRDDLERHRQIRRDVSAFLQDYRRYLQTAARRRAEIIRAQHSRYEETNREIGARTREKEVATLGITASEGAKGEAELAETNAYSRIEALRESPFQQDAIALENARRQAEICQMHLDQATNDLRGRKQDATTAELDLEQRLHERDRLNEDLTVLLQAMRIAARAASFLAEHERHIAPASEWSSDREEFIKSKQIFECSTQRRSESISHLTRLHQACIDLRNDLQQAQREENAAEQRVTTERDTERLQDEQLMQLSQQLVRAHAEWIVSLTWLRPEGHDLPDQLARWLETGLEIDRVFPAIIEQAVTNAEGKRQHELAGVEQILQQLDQEIATRESEQKELETGRHLPPSIFPTRDPEVRRQIAGVPLWQACDFRPELVTTERAGLEAALESAGLLDALITPEGTLEPTEACDTFFTRIPELSLGETLNAWLCPNLLPKDPHASVLTPQSVETALQSIGISDDHGTHWVDKTGRWQLGPVRGRGRKATAQHIGEGAREAERRRRLAELASEISVLKVENERAEAKYQELRRIRVEAIRLERQRAPNDEAIARTLAVREAVRERLNIARDEYEQAQAITSAARKKHQSAVAERGQTAVDLGLSEWQESPDQLREFWQAYLRQTDKLWPTARHWADTRHQLDQAIEKLDRARVDAKEAEVRRREAELRSQEAQTRYCTLESTVGASVAKLDDDTKTAKANLQRAQKEAKAAAEVLMQARTTFAVAEQALEQLNGQLVETVRRRAEAIENVRVLAKYNLFADTHPNFGEFERDPWSVTRAVEIAREIARTLADIQADDNVWRARQTTLMQLFNDLQTSLGSHGHQPQIEQVDDTLVAVSCPFHGRPLPLGSLLLAVEAEIATQERLLSEREREVIDNHLIRDVAIALQELIRDAEAKVIEMNAEIEQCSTSTGLTMRLKWEPRTQDTPEGLAEVRKLMWADSELWAPHERASLGQFLHGLIKGARMENPQGTWSEHLRKALDYRAWHSFAIERRQNDKWERLTKRRYGTGSGGEKALMLTVPQMAAAAAHYRSAASYAPRLILLDEVFVGIDSKVRAKCMGLLEAFNLDFIMTSEREWGAYSTIKGLAIYQLISQPGINAVATTRWIWNGQQRILMDPSKNGTAAGDAEAEAHGR